MGYALKSFEKLDSDKQNRIIRAALKEFGEQGYDRASTNRIVQEAGIGKGMLFYYFNSKKELYWHLADLSLDAVQREFLDKIDDSIDDVIDRLAHISRVKWQFFTEHPEISRFLTHFFLADAADLPSELKGKLDRVMRCGFGKVYENKKYDRGRFRDDVDPDRARQLIEWTIKGYASDMMERFKQNKPEPVEFQRLWDEFEQYLRILKTCFYKQGGEEG
ncbi:MAG: TetR/AcrR family transcriptional regulator [Planifilum fimeticola]|jgi:AcrR family transcriptional regulator